MSTTPQHLPPGTGRPPLSRERIVEGALALAKEHGLSVVSMRRLARELGVQPMSLYYHVPSRAVLMVLMAQRSIASVPESEPGTPWGDRLVELMLGTYRAGVVDPAVFPVLASETLGTKLLPPMSAPAGAASVDLVERVQHLLADAAVPEADRPRLCRGLFALVVGFMVGQVDGLVPTGGDASPESDDDDLAAADLRGSDPQPAPPALRAMHVTDPAADLAAALRIFVGGLTARGSR